MSSGVIELDFIEELRLPRWTARTTLAPKTLRRNAPIIAKRWRRRTAKLVAPSPVIAGATADNSRKYQEARCRKQKSSTSGFCLWFLCSHSDLLTVEFSSVSSPAASRCFVFWSPDGDRGLLAPHLDQLSSMS